MCVSVQFEGAQQGGREVRAEAEGVLGRAASGKHERPQKDKDNTVALR